MKKPLKTIYLLSPQIKWKTFKTLQDKLVSKEGPWPVGLDKMLYSLLKEKRIYCWFSDDLPNDMQLGLKLPKFKGENVKILS